MSRFEGLEQAVCRRCDLPIYKGRYRDAGYIEPDYDPADEDPVVWRHQVDGYAVCRVPQFAEPAESNASRAIKKAEQDAKLFGNGFVHVQQGEIGGIGYTTVHPNLVQILSKPHDPGCLGEHGGDCAVSGWFTK